MKHRIFSVIGLLLLAACTKEVDWPVSDSAPALLVVEAILTDRPGVQYVRLTQPVNQLNQEPGPVSGASILLTSTDSVWSLTEQPAGSGYYLTDSSFWAQTNETYVLRIQQGDLTWSAKAVMAPPRFFTELIYTQNSGDAWYHIEWVASAFTDAYPAMWEILIDWSLVPGFAALDPDACRARLLFYTLPTLDVSEIFAPVMEQTSFPKGSVITERRYSLTSDHARFIRELLLETNWQGSLFPTANANVYTNLSAGATGYFGVCGVTEVALVVVE